MAERIPHLTGLRVFEAAARRLSFQAAAEELGLSPSAVSHQIRGLEAYLDAKLFERKPRAVALTDAGRALQPGVADGFRRIEGAVREVRSLTTRAVVVVSVGPSLAAKWLSPRLYRFEEAHPSIDLRVTMSNRAIDLLREDVDVALRHGGGDYPKLESLRLFGEAYAPLAAPAVAERLRAPADLAGARLFDDVSTRHAFEAPSWPEWFRRAGLDPSDFPPPREFHQTDHAIQAAIDGGGVLMGRLGIAGGDVAAGRLVQPFELVLPSPYGYFAVLRPGRRREKAIARFLDWIFEEAAPMAAALP